ncbi:unnamed protein product [Peniophora sp. CBMAI 1063]|nr:unnamed protein product [Peniophora sp. CBMAI 1063]
MRMPSQLSIKVAATLARPPSLTSRSDPYCTSLHLFKHLSYLAPHLTVALARNVVAERGICHFSRSTFQEPLGAAAFKMAATVDPSYPLYPIFCVLSSVSLLFVLLTSVIRHKWNLGVTFLCFWLFFENLTYAVNAVLWSDNVDVKHYVYCDIVSRLQMITFVVKPIATLIITRRLYLIICPRSTDPPDKATRRWDLAVEWTLGLGIPLLVAGPFYYVNQNARFEILEGFGCTNTMQGSILEILLVRSWSIMPPLLSVALYYSRMARVFYHHTKDVNRLLRDSATVSRKHYLRVLALASLDILLTLPFGIVNITLSTIVAVNKKDLPFYPGWHKVHDDWTPMTHTWADIKSMGRSALPQDYFSNWTSPILALAIFALFGLTTDARTSYKRIFHIARGWFGRTTPSNARHDPHPQVKLEERTKEEVVLDIKQGNSPTSSVDFEVVVLPQDPNAESRDDVRVRGSLEKPKGLHWVSDEGNGSRRASSEIQDVHPLAI